MKIIKDFYCYKVFKKITVQSPITHDNVTRELSLAESENNPDFFLLQHQKEEKSKEKLSDDEISSQIVTRMILKEARFLVQKR